MLLSIPILEFGTLHKPSWGDFQMFE